MNKKIFRLRPAGRKLSFMKATKLALLAVVVVAGSFSAVQRAGAITADEYCGKYPNGPQRTACNDGARGQSCDDYAITFDEATANICRNAKKAKDSGQITAPPSFNPNSGLCKDYSGDLLAACNGGREYKQCNPAVAEQDPDLFNACAKGAGLPPVNVPDEALNPSSGAKNDPETYKAVILAACAPYQNDTAAALWCLYGGLGQNGEEGKPKTVNDCLTKPELQGSTTNQTACITGVSSGRAFLSAVEEVNNGGSGGGGGQSPTELLDQLDQVQSLTEYIDVLHQTGPNAGDDASGADGYGYYINGAGKKQEIKVIPSGVPNGPAIVFFNGGGWHVNGGTHKKVAEGQDGAVGATARGYTVFDVTYRLGSSGVYYMFEDVMRGLRSVINNAGLYGVDPQKIAIWGDSAGGSLAMRVAASGKSGAKAAVGWSAPTNAYTGLFRSFFSLLIGMDHSTCVPTDLAGFTNITDLMNGGSGEVAEYGKGLSSNDFSGIGLNIGEGGLSAGSIDPITLLTDVLTAGQYAMQTSQNLEAISGQIEAAYNGGEPSLDSLTGSGLSGSLINLSSKKLVECIDNFNALSPALFASPESSPSFLAGFDNDQLVGPEQATGMRDKLRSLGILSEALILPGDPNAGAFGSHLGYDKRFVCPSINFIDLIIQPEKGESNCEEGTIAQAGEGGSGGGGSGGGGSGCATYPTVRLASTKIRLAAAVRPDTGSGKNEGKSQGPNAGPNLGTQSGDAKYLNPNPIPPANPSNPTTSGCGGGGGSGGGSGSQLSIEEQCARTPTCREGVRRTGECAADPVCYEENIKPALPSNGPAHGNCTTTGARICST